VAINDARVDQAFLDADILYPAVLCRTVLNLAEAGLFLPRWSDLVLEEVERNLKVERWWRRRDTARGGDAPRLSRSDGRRIRASPRLDDQRPQRPACLGRRGRITVQRHRDQQSTALPTGRLAAVQDRAADLGCVSGRCVPTRARRRSRGAEPASGGRSVSADALATLLGRLERHAPTMVRMVARDMTLELL